MKTDITRFVSGINLRQAADAVLDIDRKINFDNLNNNDVIWCKTDFLNELYDGIGTHTNNYILITHCSDYDINENIFNQRPNCIKKWFAQNVNYRHPDLIPVPIGIENHEGTNKGLGDFDIISNNSFDFSIKNKIINKLFCNFSPYTNRNRTNVASIIEQKQYGRFVYPLPFEEYVKQSKEYLFIASPRGNGIDCHRTWEALYYGCIPVVEKHFMYDEYKNLPIIQIDSWETFDMNMLTPYIEDYKKGKIFNNTEELTLEFYIKKINNIKRSL